MKNIYLLTNLALGTLINYYFVILISIKKKFKKYFLPVVLLEYFLQKYK